MFGKDPELLSLAELLNSRLFNIPDYQRAYSWTSHERRELFADIGSTFQKGEKHFMATIVCLRTDITRRGTTDYEVLDIVDGQQRLTTLILLLNAIRLELDTADIDQKEAHTELSKLLVKTGSHGDLLLQPNHDRKSFFTDFLRDGTEKSARRKAETTASRELLKAIGECKEFVGDWSKNRSLLELLACIKNDLHFVLHVLSDEKQVYTVFEVLNSRGLPVSWLDRLKSMLMGRAYDLENKQLIKHLRDIWSDIYSRIGLRQGLGTEALRFAATLYQPKMPSRPLSERDAVEGFSDSVQDGEGIERAARWLRDVTEACIKVTSNQRQNAVTEISQARLLSVAIHLRNDIDESDRTGLLEIWEKVTFRIYGMMGKDARKRVGDYVRLAWRVAKGKLAAEEIHVEIRNIGKAFPIEDAVKELRNANCYEGWGNELRYFMFRYEEHLRHKAGQKFRNEHWEHIWRASPSKSIEHIRPQSKAPDAIKHVLGNLMILPPLLNSQLQDKSPSQKRSAYQRTGLRSAIEVADILESKPRWPKQVVKEREEKLLEWATREWAD